MDELFETDLEIAISDYVKVLRFTPVKEQIKELRLEIRELERQGEDQTEKVLELTGGIKDLELMAIVALGHPESKSGKGNRTEPSQTVIFMK